MQSSQSSIPQRPFARNGPTVSAVGIGGHHLGNAEDLPTAVRIVHKAIDGGITFFDNCWEYNRGQSQALIVASLTAPTVAQK